MFIHYTCLIQLSQTKILVVQDLASLKVHVHVVGIAGSIVHCRHGIVVRSSSSGYSGNCVGKCVGCDSPLEVEDHECESVLVGGREFSNGLQGSG